MILFVGANPGLTVRDGERRVAFVSVWRADWSQRGPGRAIVLWHEGATRVVTTNEGLGRWLAQDFTRHFPEVKGLPWPEPEIEVGEVDIELDLERGMRATANGITAGRRLEERSTDLHAPALSRQQRGEAAPPEITVDIGPPIDRRLFQTDEFDLGGVRHSLSTVFMPCASGSLELSGVPVKGSVNAFLAEAEVWSLPTGGP